MTVILNLDPDTESRLRNRAKRRGITVEEYVAGLTKRALAPRHKLLAGPKPRTGAEVLAVLEAKGILAGYGDPKKNAPELAREIREQSSHRNWGE